MSVLFSETLNASGKTIFSRVDGVIVFCFIAIIISNTV